MSINNRYVSHSSLWYHDKEELVEKITDKLDKGKLIKTYEEKIQVSAAIEEVLKDYTLYRSNNYIKRGVLGWRLLYVLFIVFQWLLWPYCFLNWLNTGNFRLSSTSRVAMVIDRIIEQSN